MNQYKLSTDDRKLLVAFMGEEHLTGIGYYNNALQKRYEIKVSRSFDSYQDAGELCEKLVGKGLYYDFFHWVRLQDEWDDRERLGYDAGINAWLNNPKRKCWLISEFLKEQLCTTKNK
jgi:hypothetical protein